MKVDLAALPTDVDALHGLVHVLVGELKARELRVEQLEARIAKLQRLQFGRSSERRTQETLEFNSCYCYYSIFGGQSGAVVSGPFGPSK